MIKREYLEQQILEIVNIYAPSYFEDQLNSFHNHPWCVSYGQWTFNIFKNKSCNKKRITIILFKINKTRDTINQASKN